MTTSLYRRGRLRAYHLHLRMRRAAFEVGSQLRPARPGRHDPYALVTVSPGQVTLLTEHRFPSRFEGRVLGGDWDRAVLPLQETAVYRGLHQRFAEGRCWLDTDLHPARYERLCPNEPVQYENYSEADLSARGAALDRLYGRLAEQGFRDHASRGEPAGTEMNVAVTRMGAYARHAGGLHRLIMAQLLGLPRIPVRVFVVHSARVGCAEDPFRHQREAPSGGRMHEPFSW